MKGKVVSATTRRVITTLVKWFGFAVFMGSLPVIFAAGDYLIRKGHLSLTGVLKTGDLFLISVAILAAALANLPMKGDAEEARTVALIATVILIAIAIGAFVDVSSLVEDQKHYDEALVAYGSLGLFVISFFTAGSCVALGEALAPPVLPTPASGGGGAAGSGSGAGVVGVATNPGSGGPAAPGAR